MLSDTIKKWAEKLDKVVEENKFPTQEQLIKWYSHKSNKERWIEEQEEHDCHTSPEDGCDGC